VISSLQPVISSLRSGPHDEWLGLGEGYTLTRDAEDNYATTAGSTNGAIQLARTAGTKGTAGAYQGIDMVAKASTDTRLTAVYIGGASRASGLNTTFGPGSYHSMYWDVTFTDASEELGNFEPFPNNDGSTGGYVYVDRVWSPSKALSTLTYNTILRNQAGDAVFDQLVVLWTCPLGARPTMQGGFSHGDPHLVSMDGRHYDAMTVGEFVLVSDGLVEVQARHVVAGLATVNGAVAVSFQDGSTVQIDRAFGSELPSVYLNGVRTTYNTPGDIPVSGGGTTVLVSGALESVTQHLTFTMKFETSSSASYEGEEIDTEEDPSNDVDLSYTVQVTVHRTAEGYQFLHIYTSFPDESRNNTYGLLGNWNGEASDDWMMPDDTVAVDFDDFTNSWVLTSATSGFVHLPGETAESLHDPDYVAATLANFSAADQAEAIAACEGAGVHPLLLDNCALDYLAFDRSVASTAYLVSGSVLRADAAILDEAGEPEVRVPEAPGSGSSAEEGIVSDEAAADGQAALQVMPFVGGGVLAAGLLAAACAALVVRSRKRAAAGEDGQTDSSTARQRRSRKTAPGQELADAAAWADGDEEEDVVNPRSMLTDPSSTKDLSSIVKSSSKGAITDLAKRPRSLRDMKQGV
jgi:hypothetical protein